MPRPSVESFNKRLSGLKSEESSYRDLWYELSEYHMGNSGRFININTGNERNRGYRRNTKQINNTSYLSGRTLAAGMMAGITSPARPWFMLSSGDPELNEVKRVKRWLFETQALMYRVYAASNTYNVLHSLYKELGVFGTAAMGVYQDYDNVIRCKPYTIGGYLLDINGQGQVDTFYREYTQSVGQVVKMFGYENCPTYIQKIWDKGDINTQVNLVHAVEPNDTRDMVSPLAADKAYRSVYYDRGISGSSQEVRSDATGVGRRDFLLESGFDEFPIMAPRWDVIGEDIYASDCPGLATLGDTKTLQLGEKRMYQAIDKIVSPPLQAPSTLRNKIANSALNPNEIVYADGDGLKSIYDNSYRPDVNSMVAVNGRCEERIRRGFYEDLFLSLIGTDRRQITAREVAERHEEKLLMLGPVLERLHNELLDPLIDRTFNILQRNGVLPPPPPELEDREINVEYVSVLAQAQRMVATGAIEQIAGFTGNLAALWPEARHKINATQAIDDYANALGVNPEVIRSDDEAQAMAQAEQNAQAQAQAMAQASQLADVAKTASETEVEGQDILSRTAENLGIS